MSDIDITNLGNLNVNTIYANSLQGGLTDVSTLRDITLTARNANNINDDSVNATFSYGVNPTFSFDLNTNIKGVANPIDDNDVVNQQYVDGLTKSLSIKQSVKVASIEDVAISSFVNNVLKLSISSAASMNIITSDLATIDGILFNKNDDENDRRILVKNQANAIQNGIYLLTNIIQSGSFIELTRADDFINANLGDLTFVRQGTNIGKYFILKTTDETSNQPVVNTNTLGFEEFGSQSTGGTGGTVNLTPLNGIDITNNEIKLDLSASTVLGFDNGKLHMKSSTNQGELLVSSGTETTDPIYSNSIGRTDENLKIQSTGLALNKLYDNAGEYSSSINYGDEAKNGSIRTITKRTLNESLDVNGENTQFLLQRKDNAAGIWKNICIFTS